MPDIPRMTGAGPAEELIESIVSHLQAGRSPRRSALRSFTPTGVRALQMATSLAALNPSLPAEINSEFRNALRAKLLR